MRIVLIGMPVGKRSICESSDAPFPLPVQRAMPADSRSALAAYGAGPQMGSSTSARRKRAYWSLYKAVRTRSKL